jgi:hypothetical protein
MWEELTAGWRDLHNEKLHSSYYSPIIITVFRAETVKWPGIVAHMY